MKKKNKQSPKKFQLIQTDCDNLEEWKIYFSSTSKAPKIPSTPPPLLYLHERVRVKN